MLGLAAAHHHHLQHLFSWVSHHGYFAIAGLLVLGIAGVPVPDETLLAFAGYLVWRGRLSLAPTILAAFVGSACGISVSYLLGRTAGAYLLRRFGTRLHATPERMERVHGWFERYGRWTLSLGYFVPGVRHLTALSAGMSRLDLPSFALFAYAGALVWTSTFIVLGRLLGASWKRLEGAHLYVAAGAGALLLVGLAVWLLVRLRRR